MSIAGKLKLNGKKPCFIKRVQRPKSVFILDVRVKRGLRFTSYEYVHQGCYIEIPQSKSPVKIPGQNPPVKIPLSKSPSQNPSVKIHWSKSSRINFRVRVIF